MEQLFENYSHQVQKILSNCDITKKLVTYGRDTYTVKMMIEEINTKSDVSRRFVNDVIRESIDFFGRNTIAKTKETMDMFEEAQLLNISTDSLIKEFNNRVSKGTIKV